MGNANYQSENDQAMMRVGRFAQWPPVVGWIEGNDTRLVALWFPEPIASNLAEPLLRLQHALQCFFCSSTGCG
jgi:hypothetical protein